MTRRFLRTAWFSNLRKELSLQCPFNALQICRICYINSVQLTLLSIYTSFVIRSRWAHSIASTSPVTAGTGETNIACFSSRKGVSMKKIRCFLAAIALVASLSVPLLQGMGAVANAAFSRHASSVSSQFAVNRYPPCPGGGTYDC